MESSVETSGRWWLDRKLVDGYVDGVFEGGGAKGVLYAGALEAVLRRRLWFSAVAGASAGAITAAMIAAGMHPLDIAAETDTGLSKMATPSTFSGVRRIRWGTGFLDHAAVLDWLRDVMCARMKALGVTVDSRGPSFATLFDVTGIGLFVAAVDLSARNVAVFTHSLTPNARIAETVMASATIPGGFEPMFFGKEPPWRLFVDGGVASNYPVFVLSGRGFPSILRVGRSLVGNSDRRVPPRRGAGRRSCRRSRGLSGWRLSRPLQRRSRRARGSGPLAGIVEVDSRLGRCKPDRRVRLASRRACR